MDNFLNANDQYCLHDTTVDKIFVKKNKLVFHFDRGVYMRNSLRDMMDKTTSCEMRVYIHDLSIDKLYQHVEITRFKKNKRKEIDFFDIQKLLKKDTYTIHLDYYSPFARSLLLKGFLGKFELECSITEIEQIVFSVDDENKKAEHGF